MNSDMISYYKDRANEYEKVYSKPERQNDLLIARQILQQTFKEKEILEIACGTGYWTEIISRSANSILATDINETAIEVARSKTYSPATVDFKIADLFKLSTAKKHQSLFGGFIWSHIKLQELDHFIGRINSLVESGGTIVFIDNNYVAGSSLPISAADEFGNTYQTRTLENGTSHNVLKNFPNHDFLMQLMAGKAADIEFINLEYYWILKYRNNL